MKRILGSVCMLLVMMAFSVNVNATKWKNGGSATYGTCHIQYQYCDQVFLSFDGCEVGDVQAIFDPNNADCQTIVSAVTFN